MRGVIHEGAAEGCSTRGVFYTMGVLHEGCST